MPVFGIMNALVAKSYSSPKKVIVACSVLMDLYLARRSKLMIHVELREIAVMQAEKTLDKPYLKWLTLFITSSTLLCCALPVLLVTLGFGAVVASLNYNIPGLVFLSENKLWTLLLSAIMLMFLAWVIWRPNQSCPPEPELAKQCHTAKRWNKRIFWLSVAIWGIGFFFSILLLPLRNLLNI